MKKLLRMILSLLLCIVLTACSFNPSANTDGNDTSDHTESSQKNYFPIETEKVSTEKQQNFYRTEYEMKVLPQESFFKEDYLYKGDESVSEKISDQTEYVIQIGKQERTVYHTETNSDIYGQTTYSFVSVDDQIRYTLSSVGPCFSMHAKNGVVSAYENQDLTEEALLSFIKDYIASFVDFDMGDYVYSCKTVLGISTGQAAWREDKDGFYIVPEDQADRESIFYYEFQFDKLYKGCRTEEYISVRCEPNGDISYIGYYDRGVNWSDYDIFTERRQRENIIDEASRYLREAFSDEYKIGTPQLIGDPVLVYCERERAVRLAVGFKVYVASSLSGNYSTPFICTVTVGIK